jgi:hypothetical protein
LSTCITLQSLLYATQGHYCPLTWTGFLSTCITPSPFTRHTRSLLLSTFTGIDTRLMERPSRVGALNQCVYILLIRITPILVQPMQCPVLKTISILNIVSPDDCIYFKYIKIHYYFTIVKKYTLVVCYLTFVYAEQNIHYSIIKRVLFPSYIATLYLINISVHP